MVSSGVHMFPLQRAPQISVEVLSFSAVFNGLVCQGQLAGNPWVFPWLKPPISWENRWFLFPKDQFRQSVELTVFLPGLRIRVEGWIHAGRPGAVCLVQPGEPEEFGVTLDLGKLEPHRRQQTWIKGGSIPSVIPCFSDSLMSWFTMTSECLRWKKF